MYHRGAELPCEINYQIGIRSSGEGSRRTVRFGKLQAEHKEAFERHPQDAKEILERTVEEHSYVRVTGALWEDDV